MTYFGHQANIVYQSVNERGIMYQGIEKQIWNSVAESPENRLMIENNSKSLDVYNDKYDTGYHITAISYAANFNFLNPLRSSVRFVDTLDDDLKEMVNKTFGNIFGHDLPEDISIQVCDKAEFEKAHIFHGGTWSNGLLGFAINETREIFVLNTDLDNLMVTIGHELGHILSPPLRTRHDEEAKAFAFQKHWVQTIMEHNIGGIGGNFMIAPASNGLHDVAAGFVENLVQCGNTAFEIFRGLVNREIVVGEPNAM